MEPSSCIGFVLASYVLHLTFNFEPLFRSHHLFSILLSPVAVLFLPTTDGFSHKGFPLQRFLMRLWDLFFFLLLLCIVEILFYCLLYIHECGASAALFYVLLWPERPLKQWEC